MTEPADNVPRARGAAGGYRPDGPQAGDGSGRGQTPTTARQAGTLRTAARATGSGTALLLAACAGPQSALDPAGHGAQRIAELFLWMTVVGGLIWAAVIGLAVYAVHVRKRPLHDPGPWLIVGGGIVFPSVVLTLLLIYGLMLLADLRAAPTEPDLRVEVSGEQWWWRVRYPDGLGGYVELANELYLPLDAVVELRLDSPDVIHSFWVPSLGGKMDLVPGQTTTLLLRPTRSGVFHGVCAEYCGDAHALMKFRVVVTPAEDYAAWLDAQAAPARQPESALARAGQEAFLANGCGACHTVRGTPALGRVGPDLTHVGSRLTLAAGTLPTSVESFAAWIDHPLLIKPGVRMPAFGMLPDGQVEALAAYLQELR